MRLEGEGALSTAELLALIFSSGSRKEDAISLAGRLLEVAGGLGALSQWPLEKLMAFHGIGPAKASQIRAFFALLSRLLQEKRAERPRILKGRDLIPYVKEQLRFRDREVFAMALLDQAHRLIAVEELFEGGINYASVSPRVVVTRALERRAAALVLLHNHPSGQGKASAEDIALTRTLKKALNLVEIRLLDHLLVAADQVFPIEGWR
jgi:DNA repair protein RadC